ncbi:unnamed protein product [Rotaria sp. Silwood2]|nr:unnamed protein product [Rotaria sp. Silwood2]CAF2493374.1 unnamed protein product [Rotaria sp. Silwood2]CAF2722872.1 unnamed protein product [Rotaria sp. Silwood2]CAF2875989.1 unnamed protein product [Rotaria sp. Silwood2]CAF4305910.1 unnamed protein product [Rotaria sp. Silwood2]
MTSLTIPSEWLIPQKVPNKWIFQCSIRLRDLVITNRARQFFRQLVDFLEQDSQLIDYHLELQHNSQRNNELDVWICFGDPIRASKPAMTPVCMSCELTHELSMASLLSEQQYTRVWLDGKARSMLILTPIRHVERLSELNDENGEMKAFWDDAIELIDRECNQLETCYRTMVLNHGTYRNHSHLHLKIKFTDDIWNRIIAPRHREEIQQINQLLQKLSVIEDCFGPRYFQRLTKSKIPDEKTHSSNQDAKN